MVKGKPMRFEVGQRVLRNREAQNPFQRENWERWARRKEVDPYGPVEVIEIDDMSGDLYIKECGMGARWQARNFMSVIVEKELEDYL